MTKKQFYAGYLCVLQALDALLTWWGVSYLGIGTNAEGNPIVKYIMDSLGVVPGLVLIKAIAIIAIIFIFNYVRQGLLLILCTIYSLVVGLWIYVFLFHNFLL